MVRNAILLLSAITCLSLFSGVRINWPISLFVKNCTFRRNGAAHLFKPA